MDTTIMYHPNSEDTIYERSNMGPDTMFMNMRTDLLIETQMKVQVFKEDARLKNDNLSQLEFENYYNCDVDSLIEQHCNTL